MADVISDNPRMTRVRQLTTVMLGLTGIFFVYWNIWVFSWVIPFIFGGGMQVGEWVDDGVVVTFGQHAAYFAIWTLTVSCAWAAFYYAFHMLIAFRAGVFFDAATCRKIQMFGGALVAVIATDTMLSLLTFPIFTWANPVDGAVGYAGPSLVVDSGNITIALCGLGFLIIGWVFHEAVQMVEENKGFV